MAARLSGSCYCGAARYVVDDAFEYAMNCHCSNCRRRSGSAFKAIGGVDVARVTLDSDPASVTRVGSSVDYDVFCHQCGSLLYAVVREGAYAHVALGTLTNPPSIKPTHHIFVGSKAPWFEITDDLPQYHELP